MATRKESIIKTLIAFLGCIIVILMHQVSYEWYMSHYSPRSRGVSLGFVMLYMRYIIIPIVFLSTFIKLKYSLLMVSVVILYMFNSWYGTNPLRVLLMFSSCSIGYSTVIICGFIKDKFIVKNDAAVSNKS